MYRNGLLKKYGLDGWGENNRALLWFIPLWIIASGNFWGGFLPDCHGSAIITAAVSMAFFKCGSLIPCIIAHCVIDVSSVFTADKTGLLNVIFIIVFFSFAIGYCLYLLHIKTPDIQKTETNIK